MFKLIEGINNCTNPEYHSDKEWLSSSSLKTLLQSPKKYHDEHVLGLKKDEPENPAYIEGSLTHSLILEGDRVPIEYAFFPGLRKQGAEYEEFKAANPEKTIISAAQNGRCQAYLRAFQNNPAAVDLIRAGFPEYSIAQIIDGVKCKMRADWIDLERNFIVDVKTSGFPVTHEEFKLTIEQYKYALSAAFYCRIAEQFYGRPFDFYFVAISKKELDCQVYKVSEMTRRKGNSEVARSLDIYKKCVQSGVWPASLDTSKGPQKYEILEV